MVLKQRSTTIIIATYENYHVMYVYATPQPDKANLWIWGLAIALMVLVIIHPSFSSRVAYYSNIWNNLLFHGLEMFKFCGPGNTLLLFGDTSIPKFYNSYYYNYRLFLVLFDHGLPL